MIRTHYESVGGFEKNKGFDMIGGSAEDLAVHDPNATLASCIPPHLQPAEPGVLHKRGEFMPIECNTVFVHEDAAQRSFLPVSSMHAQDAPSLYESRLSHANQLGL